MSVASGSRRNAAQDPGYRMGDQRTGGRRRCPPCAAQPGAESVRAAAELVPPLIIVRQGRREIAMRVVTVPDHRHGPCRQQRVRLHQSQKTMKTSPPAEPTPSIPVGDRARHLTRGPPPLGASHDPGPADPHLDVAPAKRLPGRGRAGRPRQKVSTVERLVRTGVEPGVQVAGPAS